MTTYLITGAGRGIGQEFVRQLLERGETVLAAARDTSRLPVGVTALELDVSDGASIEAMAKAVAGRPVDVLINNAGVNSPVKSLEELTAGELERVYRINVVGPMMVTRALLPSLRAGRRRVVVNISSMMGSLSDAASKPNAKSYAYRSSKSALNMLTVCMANELRPEGFTCVAVHPGWVRTDMGGNEAPLTVSESVSAMLKTIESLTPERTGAFIERDGRTIAW
jgi:NAD(P)-dependent dehydrogenase (short-subunit alcohol dehydrogenase family)